MKPQYFTDDPELTKFGWFQVRDFKSFSKYEVWQYCLENNIPVEELYFNFNDDSTCQLDWTVEPAESISSMYARRARQLRENYDYIVLLYSGGIDSHVMLHSFLDNGIHVDEIMTFCNLEFLDKSAKFNQEVFKVAVPYIESLNLKDTKVNLYDVGKLIQESYGNIEHLNRFLYMTNGTMSTWTIAVRSAWLKLRQSHQLELAKLGKRIAYVWGMEKPVIMLDNGRHAFKYYDYTPDFASKNYFSKVLYGQELKNFTDETFFVCKEFPEISIKQGHLVVNELLKMDSADPRLVGLENLANTGPYVEHQSSKNFETGKWLKKAAIEKIIYPDAPHEKFGDDKIKGSTIFTSRDSWFFRSKHPNRNRFVEHVKKAMRDHEGYFNYLRDGTASNSIPVGGIPHYIKHGND